MNPIQRREIQSYLEHRLDTLKSHFPEESLAVDTCADENEYASNLAQQHISLALRERSQKQVRVLEDALRRLRAHDYGECEECGDPIGLARLKANPEATLCVHCQAELENEELKACA